MAAALRFKIAMQLLQLKPPPPYSRYYCIDDLVEATGKQLAKLKEEHHPICRVPVITSLEEEHLIVSTSAKVGVPVPLSLALICT